MAKPVSVLFVCLGNICRSPLAEAAFRVAAERAGLSFRTDSAGTGDWHIGSPPDPRAQSVARSAGVEISHYRARQLIPDDFFRFDHVLVMDHANLTASRRIAPDEAVVQAMLLLEQAHGRAGAEVSDPYYGDASDFAMTWREVSAAADALIAKFLAESA